MFTRLVKRASAPAQSLRSATLNNNNAIRNNGSNYRILRTNVVSIRHQSSSSSSRDNDNSNNQDIEPITSNEVPINASIELHRVDLAHDPVDDLTHYFSTLHPYSPPNPLTQSTLVTPTATAWASLAPSMPDADLAVEEFLSLVEEKQHLQQRQEEEQSGKQTSTTTTAAATATSGDMDGNQGSIVAESILDPMLEESNVMYMTSVLRKRRIKMRKHKYKKLRKRTRALRKKLGK
ncbi:hypothetical protein BGX24_005646 [Mortierella sp. AD032]|nr:hypothetical protein BGX24_005646 [Mortierella sp. AD032]